MNGWANELDEQLKQEGLDLPILTAQIASMSTDGFRKIVGNGGSALQRGGMTEPRTPGCSGFGGPSADIFVAASQGGYPAVQAVDLRGSSRGESAFGKDGYRSVRGGVRREFNFGGLPSSTKFLEGMNESHFGGGLPGSSHGHALRGGFRNISKRFNQPESSIRPLGGIELPAKSAPAENEVVENPMSPEEIALLNKFIHRTVNHMKNGSVDIVQQQQDPSSPLHSLVNFRELRIKEDLLKALDIMGFQQPSKIQEFALPLLLMEPPTNMIAQSQSGTGKTAAFVLTMLSRVIVEDKFPQCVCLAPTYELAMQIGEVVDKMAQFIPDIKVHYAVKGAKARGIRLTEQIVIGTPGTLNDYLTKYQPFDASKINCIVLDEADVMISQQGHKDLSIRIYSEVEKANPTVQALLFSATYDDEVIKFAEQLIKRAVMVTLRKEEQTLPNIKQFYVECANRDAKYDAVVNLYSGMTIASAIIFCHTRQSAAWLADKMAQKGHDVALLHGDLSVEERAASIEQFKNGFFKVLITTNVCARGIDVSQVSIVINYDPPIRYDNKQPDYETYLHRIGRTGRFGKNGIAINFVDSKENLDIINKIADYFQKPIERLDPSDIDQLEVIENEEN